jgi:hypothetical protein
LISEPLVVSRSSAYGPVSPGDVPGLFDASFLTGTDHLLGRGPTEAVPYLAKQERLNLTARLLPGLVCFDR